MKRKTLLNGESGHLALMLVLSVATQCVALLKSTVTASAFGASMEMDAYNFSNNIILFLFSFLSSGITAVVIPAYVQKRPGEVTDSFLTFLYLLVFGGTGLIYLFREPLIGLLSNRDAAFRQAAAGQLLIKGRALRRFPRDIASLNGHMGHLTIPPSPRPPWPGLPPAASP